MKIVINECYGGFEVPDEFYEEWITSGYSGDIRTNERFIEFVGDGYEFNCSELVVAEIPDNATDYFINEYDGMETIFYVVDGKIHTI